MLKQNYETFKAKLFSSPKSFLYLALITLLLTVVYAIVGYTIHGFTYAFLFELILLLIGVTLFFVLSKQEIYID